MQSIATSRSFTARAESLARLLVQGSAVAAVVVGCLIADPRVGFFAGLTFVVAALMAHRRFESTTAIVLFLAYISGGIMLAVPVPLKGAPLWLAAMSGLVAGGLPWRTWSAPPAWRWPLILWLLGVALSWPIVALRETDFSLIAPRTLVGSVIIFALLNFSSGLWLDALLSWDAEVIERRVARPLLASAAVSACAVFYQAFVDITWLSGPPWVELRRAPGLMADANPMAVALGMWAPLAFSMVRPRYGSPTAVVAAITLSCAAWLTGARTVILVLGAGVVGIVKGVLSGMGRTRLLILMLSGTVAVGAIIAFVAPQISSSGPLARLLKTFPVRQPRVVLYEAFWYRDGYGVAAVESIRRHPWSGVGVGTHNAIQGDYHPNKGLIPVFGDNAQNLWRHALAERGVLAFVAVAALTLNTFRILLRPSRAPPLFASTLKATIIGLGLALMFGVPTHNVAIAVTAATVVGWLQAFTVQPQTLSSRRYAAALMIAWGLAVTGAAVDGWKAITDLRPAARAADRGDLFAYGFGNAQIGPDGSQGRAVLGRAVVAIPVASTDYELLYWTQSADATRLRVWQEGTLVMDELVHRGEVGRRDLRITPKSAGVLLEFKSDSSDVIVGGRFR